jgi:hypothetical protein
MTIMTKHGAHRGKWSHFSFVMFLILALAPMCSNASSSCADLSSAQRLVAETAKNYILRTYPDFKADDLCLQVVESQEKWEVTYQLPTNRLGGSPVVLVDKQTGNVLRSYRTQ